MSTSNVNVMSDAIANAVNTSAPVLNEDSFKAELARLKAEKAQILAAKNAPPVVAAPVAPPANATAADAKLLEIINKFISKPRADGKPSGTFAVKVHSYFHACGIDEMKTREIIASAEKRNVISKMSIPTKNGNRMMLYFDARVRPANSFTGEKVTPVESASVLAAFGL